MTDLHITRRKNGENMTTLRVEHTLSRKEFVAMLAVEEGFAASENGFDYSMSKAAIVKSIKDGLWMQGKDRADYGHESHSEEEFDEMLEWAESEVARNWPNWKERWRE